jgi:hypothetical protein
MIDCRLCSAREQLVQLRADRDFSSHLVPLTCGPWLYPEFGKNPEPRDILQHAPASLKAREQLVEHLTTVFYELAYFLKQGYPIAHHAMALGKVSNPLHFAQMIREAENPFDWGGKPPDRRRLLPPHNVYSRLIMGLSAAHLEAAGVPRGAPLYRGIADVIETLFPGTWTSKTDTAEAAESVRKHLMRFRKDHSEHLPEMLAAVSQLLAHGDHSGQLWQTNQPKMSNSDNTLNGIHSHG